MDIHYGVTGTQSGLTREQHVAFYREMMAIPPSSVQHNGLCTGADEHFLWLGVALGHVIVGHPGVDGSGKCDKRAAAASVAKCDVVHLELPYMRRNTVIVMASSRVLGGVGEDHEVLRSGTWSTLRRARDHGRATFIIAPDGSRVVWP